MNCAPVCENWTMTGDFASFAAASAPLIVCDPIALTDGSAHFASLQ